MRPVKPYSCFDEIGNRADTQLYKRLCPSVRPLVRPLVRHARVENAKTRIYDAAVAIVCVLVCWRGVGGVFGVRLGVGCPYPPVRNDIVTPRHLLLVCIHPSILPPCLLCGSRMNAQEKNKIPLEKNHYSIFTGYPSRQKGILQYRVLVIFFYFVHVN